MIAVGILQQTVEAIDSNPYNIDLYPQIVYTSKSHWELLEINQSN